MWMLLILLVSTKFLKSYHIQRNIALKSVSKFPINYINHLSFALPSSMNQEDISKPAKVKSALFYRRKNVNKSVSKDEQQTAANIESVDAADIPLTVFSSKLLETKYSKNVKKATEMILDQLQDDGKVLPIENIAIGSSMKKNPYEKRYYSTSIIISNEKLIESSSVNDMDEDNSSIKEMEQTPISSIGKSHFTNELFESLPISVNTKKAISEIMKFSNMTAVQKESMPTILAGRDVLVKAKTGTGKTLGFLIPAIENLIKEKHHGMKNDRANARDGKIRVEPVPKILILSPTRELAQQIAAEAKALCTYHRMKVLLLVGGMNINTDIRLMNHPSGESDIFIGTPGRILQHLKDTDGFVRQCQGVKIFIMDEADRLLDMGFKKDIDAITRYLNSDSSSSQPGQGRQTLLFSATVSKEIQDIAKTTLRTGYEFIDTVGDDAVEQTHSHVPQYFMSVSMEDQLRMIITILNEKRLKPNYKIIVFFPTARQTGYYATMFNSVGFPVLEIHSRKSQGHRNKVSVQFRNGNNMIMFSSDVSARGMDYPDVTFVLQVGSTTRDQYVHRLGRTARAGKEGSGLLLLANFEVNAMMEQELAGLPIQSLAAPPIQHDQPMLKKISTLMSSIKAKDATDDMEFGEDSERDSAEMAWAAWLGYYNSMTKKLAISKEELVSISKKYASSIGLNQLPVLPKRSLSKMGLLNVPGLLSAVDTPRKQSPNQGNRRPGQSSTQSSSMKQKSSTVETSRKSSPNQGNRGGASQSSTQSSSMKQNSNTVGQKTTYSKRFNTKG